MNCATRRSTYRASAVAANARRAVASVPPARVAESDPSAAVDGWDVPGLRDATGWEPATVYQLPAGIVLSADAMEPTVVTSTVAARNVSARGDGSFVVEMEALQIVNKTGARHLYPGEHRLYVARGAGGGDDARFSVNV